MTALLSLGATTIILLIGLSIVAWLLPILIAKKRKHPNFASIAIIDLLLGWTFIGWVACLAWSVSNFERRMAER
jgi:hypothetical protein